MSQYKMDLHIVIRSDRQEELEWLDEFFRNIIDNRSKMIKLDNHQFEFEIGGSVLPIAEVSDGEKTA